MAEKPEKREETIFYDALEKEPADREAYLKEACGDDQGLYDRVEALLRAYDTDDSIHHLPAVDSRSTLGSSPDTERPGSVIGRYKLLERLGEGGFGAVWAAEQKRPVKRRVALKIIKLGMDTKQVVARFEAERQALALMDHPNIAKVLDAGSTDTGRPYFVMELVRGIPITEYCDQVKLSTKGRLDLFIKVCNAVQHAHQKGIIHRDIKPSNILVTLHDGIPVPRIIDFGIAKATQLELTEKTIYTRHHQFIGTPAYMSPEQAEMSGLDIDTRSDIYSLGVLLYELLTGRTPFDEKELLQSGIDQMRKIIREQEPQKPSTRLATLGMEDQSTTAARHSTDSPRLISLLRGDLDWIVMKCLEKDRTRRYETANGLALDITKHLSNETVSARPPTAIYRFQKAWRRNRVFYTAGSMVVASLLIGISFSVWQTLVANKARDEAEAAKESESILRTKAEEGEREQRLVAYAADMSLAQLYLNENNLGMVDDLLNRYIPASGEKKDDVRGIYWTHLRDVSKGDEIHTFPHETMVRSISLSADGSRLASNTLSGRVRLYDVDSRGLLWEYGGGHLSYGAHESSVALSPDGRLLAADQQGTLKVWDTASEELVFEQAHVVAPISFSPDSQSLTGVTEAGLQFWNTADWTSRTLAGDALGAASQFRVLIFTPDSNRLIFSPTRFTSKLIVYNLADNMTESELIGLDRPCVLSTNGSLVAAGGWGGYVSVWDLASRKVINKFKAHNSIVLGVALAPDGKALVTGGNDSTIKVWDIKTFSVTRSLKGHHSQIWNLKFSSDGRYLASASMDQSVKLWKWPAQVASSTDTPEAEPVIPDPKPRQSKIAGNKDADRVPRTHTIMSGDSIQATIDAAVPGDRIDIGAGIHEINEMIVVDKPLVIKGVASKETKGPRPTVLKGATGLPFVIQIKTDEASASVIRDLQIEAHASAIQHVSGALELRHCCVTIKSALDFTSVISLEAETLGSGDIYTDTVTIDNCTLLAEYSGDTIEGTPPDVDVILASSGSRYAEITVTDCDIKNDVPNAISNGIETRSTNAHVTIKGNDIHTQGLAIVMPNHVGAVDIRNNTIWSTHSGISVGTGSRQRSYIIGNQITINSKGLEVYPLFLKNYIAKGPSACINIGHTSAGVTAGFFLKEVIGHGTNFLVENNVLIGNPKHGISLVDSPDPENYGPPTPNDSHDNMFTHNDFTDLNAERDIALGASTFANVFLDNVGVKSVFREAGDDDRNSFGQAGEARYTFDKMTSPSLAGNLLGDPSTRPMWVWLPPSYDTSPDKRYPTIYMLHGFTGDHTSFKYHPMVNVDIGALAANLIAEGLIEEVIIVMPDASNVYGGSLYSSNKVIGDYRTYIASDLVKYIDGKYRTTPDRDSRGIAGNSMGAYGALSLAMEFPKVFGAVAAMSPSADFAVSPTPLDGFVKANPDTLGKPILAHNTEELIALLSGNVSVNVFYARGAAFSPNPDNPPYYVDLPLRYPQKTVVQDVWNKWLEQDMVSQIERHGQNLTNTDIFIDIGIGPVTFMPEVHDIKYLRAALDKKGLTYTFVESPGDHLSHLRERTIEVLKFLSAPGAYVPEKAQSERATK